MLDRFEQELQPFRVALNMRDYRQELLASNMANSDTPHFKARDIDFESAYAAAIGAAEGGPLQLSKTQKGHQDGNDAGLYGAAVRYRAEFQGAADGNTVNMDVERAAFAENALQMEALITFVNKRFQGRRTALEDR